MSDFIKNHLIDCDKNCCHSYPTKKKKKKMKVIEGYWI